MPEMIETQNTTFRMKAAETTLNQYCVAVLDTATEGQVKRPAAAHVGNIVGVLRDSSLAAGALGNFQVDGIALVAIASAVDTGNTLVIADVAGRAEAKTGAFVQGEGIIGKALSAGTTAGDIVKVQLEIPCEYTS